MLRGSISISIKRGPTLIPLRIRKVYPLRKLCTFRAIFFESGTLRAWKRLICSTPVPASF
jgi:hypothetical protein